MGTDGFFTDRTYCGYHRLKMPLTGLRIKNFKCFADSGESRLAPLTLIFGRNNSGKSSLIQSLLLLRQSIGAPIYGPRLNLAGPLYAAGIYRDVVYQHEVRRRISFALSLVFEETEEATVYLEFANDDPQPPRLARLVISGENRASLEICRGQGQGGPYELWIGDAKQGDERKARFSFPINNIFPLIGEEPPRLGRPGGPRTYSRRFARDVLAQLEQLLTDMRVVGAFRRPPERRYEYQGMGTAGADATGRDVVDALIESARGKRAKQRLQLLDSVNHWLEQVAHVQIMPLESIDESGKLFSLEIRDLESGSRANYADVGFGIGQALPVLVEGLRTPEGGTFIVQEPEIHLHPDAQLAMADFLIALSKSGRQVIVETHSEHLLLRVRRRLLEKDKHGLNQEDVSVIHIARDSKFTGKANHLELDKFSQIANWPTGFLSEANTERMALLEAMAAELESEE